MKGHYKIIMILFVGFLFIMPLFQEPGLSPVYSKTQSSQDRNAVLSQGSPTPQSEWSYTTGDHISSTPCVADINQDGQLEVFVGSSNQKFYCLDDTGGLLWSYRTAVPFRSSPCVADIDQDNRLEVLIGSEDGKIYCFNETGGLEWSYQTGSAIYQSAPCVADIDGDSRFEVLVGSWDNNIYCLNETGGLEWYYTTDGAVYTPCAADVDGDGQIEVIVGSRDDYVYCLNGIGMLEWRYKTGAVRSAYIADVDRDGQLEVIVGSEALRISCLSGVGELEWNHPTGCPVYSSPCVVDVDADGQLEVLVGTSWDYKVRCLSGTNGELKWSYTTGGTITSSPCVADVDGDRKLEVLVGSLDNKVYCLNEMGGLEWSYTTGDSVYSSPCVVDVDGDNQLEVLVGSWDSKLYCLSVVGAPFDESTYCWPSIGFCGDVQHSGCYVDSDGDELTDVYEVTAGSDPTEPDTDYNDVTDYNEFLHSKNPLAKKPDFMVSRGGISFEKSGGVTNVSVTVTNLGLDYLGEIKVRFADMYEDDSTQIGTDQVINGLRYKESVNVSVNWQATSFHILYVYVDPEKEVNELDETNNVACRGTGDNTPIITSVSSEYGTWTGNTVGTFIIGLGIFEAQINNPFYVYVDDLDDDIQSVVFKLGGNEYAATNFNQPSNMWNCTFDMCNIPWSISVPGGKIANIEIVVTDQTGRESSREINILGVTMPDWINRFITSIDIAGTGAVKFKFDPASQTIYITLTLPSEGKRISESRDIPDQVPTGSSDESKQGIKFWLKIRFSYCFKTGQAFISGMGELQLTTSDRGIAVNIGIDINLKPNSLELDNATIHFTLILPIITVPVDIKKVNKYLPSRITDHVTLDIGYAVGILVGVEALIKEVDTGAQMVLNIVELLIDVGVWAQGWMKADFNLGPVKCKLLVSVTSCIHFIVEFLEDGSITARLEGRPGFKLLVSLKLKLGRLKYSLKAKFEWDFTVASPEEVQVTGEVTPWSCVEDTSGFVDSRPRVAGDQDGNAMMVWCVNNPVEGRNYTDICYSIWDGTEWGTAGFVTFDEQIDFDPAITYDSNGNVMVVWSRITGDPLTYTPDDPMRMFEDQEIFYSIWNKTTRTWSNPGPITTNQCADGNAVASAGLNGAAMAIWVKDFDYNFTTANDLDLYYSVWDGTDWSPETALTSNTWMDYSPSLAYDSLGNAMVCWISDLDSNVTTTTDRELRYALWDGALQTWSPSDLVINSDEKKESPSIAFDNNDNALIVWVGGNESINRIYHVSRDKVTGLWSEPEIVREDTTFIEYPAINVDPDNNAVVVWRGFEDDSSELGEYFSDLDQNQNFTAGDFDQRDAYISQLNEQNMTNVYFDGEICYATKELSTPGATWSEVKYLTSDNKTDWMVSAVIIRGHSNDLLLVWDKEGDLSNLVHALEPDLAIDASDIMFSNNHPEDGENIDVTATVFNIGDVGAHDVLVEFFDGDPMNGGKPIESQLIDYLAYDGSVNVTIQPSFGPGTHEIYVVIDRGGSIEELNETNNMACKALSILSDLSISTADIIFSNATPSAGDPITINAIIHNQGGTCAENVKVGFFSNNDWIGDGIIGLVDAGENETVTVQWIAAAGYNNITVVIDPTNLIAEWNETNNNASTSISILPDLFVKPINLSNNDLETGQTLDISIEIMNVGAADATDVLVELFDGNPFVDGTLIYSETFDVLPLGGGEGSFIFTWTPSLGTHQVFVVVDRENLIAECFESNNVGYQELVVRSLADLNVSESDITYESGSLKIVVPVGNEGEAGAAGVVVGLYDGNPAEGGEMIFSDTIFYISPGQVSIVKLAVYEPPKTGSLYIIVDPDNAIVESDKANNIVIISYENIPQVDVGLDQVVDEGVVVQFSGSVMLPGNTEDYSYTWDFDDGSTAVGISTTHSYGDNGIYVVSLTVFGLGYSGVDHMTVTVQNVAPTVNAGPDMTGDEGTPLTFTGGFSDPGWLDAHAINWDFGDAAPPVSGTLTPTHVYGDNGDYTVTLTVTDDDGGMTSDTLTVTVYNVAPTVEAGADQSADEGDTVSFSGSFTDPGTSDTHTYEWDFGDGSTGTGMTPTHQYGDNGEYTVILTVTDKDDGVGSDTLTITVNNVAPTVDAGSDQTVDEDSTVNFDCAFTDPGWLDTHTFVWDFGDGSSTATGPLVLYHVYVCPGVYTVTLTVTDDDGGIGTDSLVVTVLDITPPVTTLTLLGSYQIISDEIYISSTATQIQLEAYDPEMPHGSGVATIQYQIDSTDPLGWVTYTVPFTVDLIGTHTVYYRSIDNAGNAEAENDVEVIVNASELTYLGVFSGVYSDPASLEARLIDIATQLPIPDKTIQFAIGSQTDSATTDSEGNANTAIVFDQQAGPYTVVAWFDNDGEYLASISQTHDFAIEKETAHVEYTGSTVVPTTVSTINLRATFLDDDDGTWGDLTKAYVTFRIYTMPLGALVLYQTHGPYQIEATLIAGVGVFEIPIPNLPEDCYTVRISLDPGVNAYYQSDLFDDVIITVYEPTGDFVTGGGWILDSDGNKGNFGFNVKYKKNGLPKGQFIYVYRTGDYKFRIKATAWLGMAIIEDHSFFEAKCVVEQYDAETDELIWSEGNYIFRVDVWDNAENEDSEDVFQILVYDKQGLVYYDSGFEPYGFLQGGSIIIHTEKEK